MKRNRKRRPRELCACIAVFLMLFASAALGQQSGGEAEVWKLEHSYWEYVKALDLVSYRALWHPDFLGWPSSSTRPVRKDHITDWITDRTAKGLHVKSYSLDPAASQATGDLVVIHYWITYAWVDKEGRGEPQTSRITHTWMKVGKGWQIINGMSARETEVRK